MDFILLFTGLALLVFSGNYLVKSGVEIARHLKVSTLVIGVTIISMGTSFPELIVSIKAALSGHPDIAIGNVVGSNIGNIAFILGLTALIYPVAVNKITLRFDWPVLMISGALLYFFIFNLELSRWEGIVLVVLLLVYIFLSFKISSKSQNKDEFIKPTLSIPVSLLILVGSIAGLYFGAEWMVKGASNIALSLGVSERAISVSVIAVGTSVPELVTSIVAAIKKQPDISLGNIVGSNIFNVFGILGVTAAISPIPVNQSTLNFDIIWMLAVSFMLLLVMLPFRKVAKVSRIEGIILFSAYITYIYMVFAL